MAACRGRAPLSRIEEGREGYFEVMQKVLSLWSVPDDWVTLRVIAPTIRHQRAAAGWRAIAAKMSNSIECGQPLSSGSFQVIVIASYRSFFFYFHRNYEEGSSRIPASHCAALQRMADRWPLQRNSGIEPLNPETAWEGTTKVEMRLIGFDSGYGFFS